MINIYFPPQPYFQEIESEIAQNQQDLYDHMVECNNLIEHINGCNKYLWEKLKEITNEGYEFEENVLELEKLWEKNIIKQIKNKSKISELNKRVEILESKLKKYSTKISVHKNK